MLAELADAADDFPFAFALPFAFAFPFGAGEADVALPFWNQIMQQDDAQNNARTMLQHMALRGNARGRCHTRHILQFSKSFAVYHEQTKQGVPSLIIKATDTTLAHCAQIWF